jgi:hypothetical protein
MRFRTASLIPIAAVLLAACPRDKKEDPSGAAVPVDSTLVAAMSGDTQPPADLSTLTSNIPEAAPDTFRRRTQAEIAKANGYTGGDAAATSRIPDAPPELMTAVQRELSFQRFCFQEFGQKADPSLAGNVAMVVRVGDSGISETRVGNSRWTSSSGQAVNTCLSQKAKQAWKVAPGVVKPGQYVVQLTFRGT